MKQWISEMEDMKSLYFLYFCSVLKTILLPAILAFKVDEVQDENRLGKLRSIPNLGKGTTII
jgi:hypothetical protein